MKSTFTLAVLATLVLSLGCATDPNKEVRAADAARAVDVRKTQEEEAELATAQKIDHAALDSEHEKQDAKMDKKVADGVIKYDANRIAAENDVIEARRTFRVMATARLQQVDAKTTELERKRAAKKVQEPALANVRTQAASVRSSVSKLDDVNDADWFTSKTTIETSLASLESDVSAIESRL